MFKFLSHISAIFRNVFFETADLVQNIRKHFFIFKYLDRLLEVVGDKNIYAFGVLGYCRSHTSKVEVK